MATTAPNKNSIATDEMVFVAGNTGSGKSVLAKVYLSMFPKVVMLDTKGDALRDMKKNINPWPQVDPKMLAISTSFDQLTNDILDGNKSHYIYVPSPSEMNLNSYDLFFRYLFDMENVTAFVDEVFAVSPNPMVIPEYYQAILTRGRTRDVAAWSLTQRPSGITPLPLSQSTHVFAFNLNLPDDRKKMAKTTGMTEFLDNPGGHNFWYYRQGYERAVKAVLELKGGE